MTPPPHTLHVSACAAERRSAAAAFLAGLPREAAVLVLVPNPNAGLWLMPEVLAPGEARFDWRRLSLEQHCRALARPVLLAAGKSYLSPVAAQALSTRVLLELAERRELGRFAAVSSQPGFGRALWSTLAELRMARVSPDALEPHDPELARISAAFDAALREQEALDLAALYELATRRARELRLPAMLALDVPVVHAAEAELLRALAEGCERVCATLPLGDVESLAAFRAALPGAAELRGPPRARGELGRLQARLFERDLRVNEDDELRPSQQRVHFVSSPGESRECVEVARAVLAAAHSGVPFDRMAVLVRSVDNYRAFLEEALARARIPAHFAAGVRRPEPQGRAFALLLRCADSGLSVRRFAEYLSLGVAPRADASVSPRYWERLLIQAEVGGRSATWGRQLAQLRQRWQDELNDAQLSAADEGRREARERQLAALDALASFALPLLTHIEALPERASFKHFREQLSTLAEQALDEPTGVQALLAELSPLDQAQLGRRELLQLLSPHLQSLIVPSEGSGAGKLQVLPVEEARGRSFERVFVVGLAEKLMPPRIREDPLLPDAVRARVSGALARLPERVARERLGLRIAAAAAREHLHLSFPRFDAEQGRPRVPSFYGLEVLEAVDGRLPGWSALAERASHGAAARLGWPAPEEPLSAIDDAEFDLAVIARANADLGTPDGALRYLVDTNPHVARALRFRARRWELPKLVAADGFVVSDASAREQLREYLSEHRYSPSALEQLAVCPYRFYLRSIVRVAAPDQPEISASLSARERGVLFHKLLHDTLTELGVSNDEPTTIDAAAAEAALERALDRLQSERAARLDPNHSRLLELELRSLRLDLQGFLKDQQSSGEWAPRASELRFGEDRTLKVAGLPLTGAIDLVEQATHQGERPLLRATDFKTGKQNKSLDHTKPAPRAITAGAHVLQPLLYALALEQLFPEAHVRAGRLYYCTRQEHYESHVVELNERTRETATLLAAYVTDMLNEGFLPAVPEPDACARCEYQVICGPHEAERVQKKQGDRRLRSLDLLRRLP
jgi:ATP-dependent helicase/nuclease subunit B